MVKDKMQCRKNRLFIWVLMAPFFMSVQLYAQIEAPSKFYFLCEKPYSNLTLFWTDNSSAETGFIIEQSTDKVNWSNLQMVSGSNVTHFSIAGYDRSESKYFRMCATDGTNNSSWSETIKVLGIHSNLEVYPEVPGIRNPQTLTIDGITFSELQDQCPSEPDKGKATRISTFFSVEVKTADGTFVPTPVYETRPQIRNNLAQNDPTHTSGHNPYHYGEYGPSSTIAKRTLHSKHWTNFDADENVIVRIHLLDNVPSPKVIDMDDLEIMPTPESITKIDDTTLELTLPGATDFTRHFRIGFNKEAWISQAHRLSGVLESPLFIFVNPIQIAPGSAPEDEIKEFNNGQLVVYGSGIHLPNNKYRFFGSGENESLRELYAPGDAYIHGGFVFKQNSYAIKVWGRAIYSDEMFDLYLSSTEYDYSVPGRTPWSNISNLQGTAFSVGDYYWEARVLFLNQTATPSSLVGFTNIGGRMGPTVSNAGNMELINHKDVGYGGGTYQTSNTKAYYKGCFLSNDDDITYVHENYQMENCTSYNMVNGPSFQMGWGNFDKQNIPVVVKNHTVFSSDRKGITLSGKNHGVFNTRLKLEKLKNHNGGYFENFHFWGQENIVFKIRIWDEESVTANTISILGDKTFKNFTIEKNSGLQNELLAFSNDQLNKKGYIRFFHFDNLVIEGNHVENIDDGDFFDYNEGTLLHSITFFSLPSRVAEPAGSSYMVSNSLSMFSTVNQKFVHVDATLPVSFSPLCANSITNMKCFDVVDAGGGYVALKALNGYYVKADPKRYGYLYTVPDTDRGDLDTKGVTEEAKFKMVDLGNDSFALFSKVMGLYVRTEANCGPELPLYAASAEVGDQETFKKNANSTFLNIQVTVDGEGTVNIDSNTGVSEGSDLQVIFTPSVNHAVSRIIIDGVEMGPVNEYTFENISENHSVVVKFSPAISGQIEAEDYVNMSGINTQATNDVGGVLNVAFIDLGDWMDYTFYVKEIGDYFVDFRVASSSENIVIDLMEGNNVLASINEPTSGGWQSWITATAESTVNLSVGEHTLRVYASGGGWNINWLAFRVDESKAQFIIETSNNEGGAIYPLGNVLVREGSSQNFTFIAEKDYDIKDVLVDGISVGAVESYLFGNITVNSTLEVLFEKSLGVNDLDMIDLVNVYPIPAIGILNVELNEKVHLSIYTMAGTQIYSGVNTGVKTSIDVSDFASGFYLLKVEKSSGSFIKRIVVE